MPCICSTFTNASSVVIFIVVSSFFITALSPFRRLVASALTASATPSTCPGWLLARPSASSSRGARPACEDPCFPRHADHHPGSFPDAHPPSEADGRDVEARLWCTGEIGPAEAFVLHQFRGRARCARSWFRSQIDSFRQFCVPVDRRSHLGDELRQRRDARFDPFGGNRREAQAHEVPRWVLSHEEHVAGLDEHAAFLRTL